MRQETFAILFLMRKGRPKKNGLTPIFARITIGGLRQEVYTQCDSNPETWNQHKERAMGTNKLAIQVNERLNDFRVKIIDIRTKLLAEGYAANAAQIKQRYLNPTCNTMMLIAGLTDYVKRRQAEVGVRITQRTADKYERLLRYLKQYLAQRGKAEDIPVERMNYEFLDGFNLFLQTAHRCRHNGAVAVMDCLRNFVLYCLRNEWITKNPFRYYKLKEDEVQAKEHLTAHELELLIRKALDHRLARIRDVFVFCCLTGLAFADADQLRREHLSQDDEGCWWIHKPREKTSVMSCIPLLPATLKILRRYEHDEICVARGRVLPTPSNQKMKRNTFRFAILAAAALTACNDTPDSLYEHEDSVQDVPDIVLESYARPYDIIPEEEWTEINFGKCIAAMGTDDDGSTTLYDQRPAHYVKLDTHIRMMKGNVTVITDAQGNRIERIGRMAHRCGEMKDGKTSPANALGLTDMCGNVMEWCSDWYGANYYQECIDNGEVIAENERYMGTDGSLNVGNPEQYTCIKNPQGPTTGKLKVLRGGSWNQPEYAVKVTMRLKIQPSTRSEEIGFRVVFDVTEGADYGGN